jgi:Kef-type K+ transport system membrane component KefB
MWLGVAAILIVLAPGTEGSAVAWLPVYALLLVAVGWVLRRFGNDRTMPAVLVLMCAFVPLSAVCAEAVGLGYVIGAFLAGAIVPVSMRSALLAQLEWPALYLLMPFFFMATGLRIDVDLLSAAVLGPAALLTAVAMGSKILGTALAARFTGERWRAGFALGTAVQTKGLMEVLVATILVDHKVIGEALFAPLILMALVCTTATAPLLRLLRVERDAGASTGG